MRHSNAIVLLEGEEQIIKDVAASLRLIDMPLFSSDSAEDVKRAVSEERPALILLRLRLRGDDAPALSLARDLAGDPELGGVPVVALCTESEKRLLAEHSALFDGSINLPVEFPNFTRQVQRFLAEPAVEKGQSERRPPAGAETSRDPETLQRNLGVVCAIQHAVLGVLTSSARLESAVVEEVPGLVLDATREICAHFDPKRLM